MVVRGNYWSILCLAVLCTWLYVVWPSAAATLLKNCLSTGNHVQLRVRLNISSHVFELIKKLQVTTANCGRIAFVALSNTFWSQTYNGRSTAIALPVTHPDVPYHPPPPSSSSSLKDMLCLYQLVMLVLEHEEDDIKAFRIHVHPLTSRRQVPRSSENYGLYMTQIRSDTEVIQM